jgi:transposase
MAAPTITSPLNPDVQQLRGWLERMVATLRFVELVTAIVALVTRMRDINTELTKRLAQMQRGRPRSERLAWLERQLVLPLAGLAQPTPPSPDGDAEAVPAKRSRKAPRPNHPGRTKLPAHLERRQVINPVPPEQRICPRCGVEMKTVGHSACEILDIIPAQLVVTQRLDERVACPKDDTIVSAPTPPAIVERGKLGDTLIIESLADKYIEHQPIERQCTRFARAGVSLAPQTLGRSVAAAIDLLDPIARMIAAQTRGSGLLGTDATGLPVLDPDASGGIRSGTIWCWTNALWVTFDYASSASSDSARSFLGDDLDRTVQCDGTSTLNFIERGGGKRPGCWGHARRGLVELARAADLVALEGVRKIAGIFAVERASALAGDTAEQRRARRQERTRPILDDICAWVDEHRAVTPPRSALGRALGYLHRQWHRLTLFLEDGNIEVTNNRRERELRRLVLGRKNWLFVWLDLGGERAASILTIIATCIAHDVNPRAYLHLVSKLIVHGWPHARARELLPDVMLATHPELYIGEIPPDIPEPLMSGTNLPPRPP